MLIEGRAIQIHPLGSNQPYNAELIDGDQMPVHVPLSAEASEAESRYTMSSVYKPAASQDGTPAVTPTKDVVLGIYYLTLSEDENMDEVDVTQVTKKYGSIEGGSYGVQCGRSQASGNYTSSDMKNTASLKG